MRANSMSGIKIGSQAEIGDSPRIDLTQNMQSSGKKIELEPIKEANSSAEKSKNKEEVKPIKIQLVPPQ